MAFEGRAEIPRVLETERCRLQVLTDDDAGALLAHFSDPAVVEYLDFEPLATRQDALDIVTWADGLLASGRGVRWSIRARAGDAFLGTCGFNSLVFVHGRRGELGYDLGVAHWGQGLMQEVLREVIHTGFGLLKLARVQALVSPGNVRSERLLRGLGFALEGVLRDHGFWRGQLWDQSLYALLSEEWG